MLTKNEITALSLSPTKKDFVQIWNELLEVAGKLSERWDPTSTNESDPGIVILKALTGIADKLNYNIDKNTLEAFMPTAAQEDSMRKLCDMLGYNIKYYQSAITDVTIKYYNPSEDESGAIENGLPIPKFTVITNSDQDISYFTTNQTPYYISAASPSVTVPCMEGQIVKCESINDNSVITVNQISENNRFYLPETQIAENGIFIYNVFNSAILGGSGLEDGTPWEKVDNLNVQVRGSRVFKFGYDSYEGRPYVEFPEDYSELFNDGLFLYYTRTNGINGNVSSGTLTQLELPSSWKDISAESFSVENIFAATTGANAETIKQSYNNFKKTIGTFETLVTCRDYMNKIYTLTDSSNKPLVSNILVTDIRNDLNRSVIICSCDDAGIFYKETPLFVGNNAIGESTTISTPTFSQYQTDIVLEGEVEEQPYDTITHEATKHSTEILDESSVSEITEYIATEGNKPFYDTSSSTTQAYVLSQGQMVSRTTNWYIGTSNTKLPVYSDTWFSSLVSDDDKYNFDSRKTGEVSAYHADGSRSDYWLITQGGTTYQTLWPITWAENRITTTAITQKETWTQVVENKYKRVDVEQQTRDKVLNTVTTKTIEKEYAIDNFDLVFYPFKSYTQIKGYNPLRDETRTIYDASFTYQANGEELTKLLEAAGVKTISHNVLAPRPGDVVCINNYLRLNATIATNSKVTVDEGKQIIGRIKVALANAFNMRELDFGEEIPFDSIVEVIENADSRIRVAAVNEPALYTTFSVYEGTDRDKPIIKEYAVESDWLSVEAADTTGRFDMKFDRNGNLDTKAGRFNTKTAKEIYNKLAVRNILAGRVPLFKYNNTFKTSFSEGAYQITSTLDAAPANLPADRIPTKTNPYTIWTDGDKTYTGQYKNENEITYTATEVPAEYADSVVTAVADNKITDITTSCVIYADNGVVPKAAAPGETPKLTLSSGEFVKFRAPNFITTKTYPAYVNYHLALDKEHLYEAQNAKASTLFDLLNTNNKWEDVLTYFKGVDAGENGVPRETPYTNKFKLTQKISKLTQTIVSESDLCTSENSPTGYHELDTATNTCKYCGAPMENNVQKGDITLEIENASTSDNKETPESLLAKSGCVKLTNDGFKAILKWDTSDGDAKPEGDGPILDIPALNLSSPFITNSTAFSQIQEAINEWIGANINSLPTACAWTITFEFECVPFDAVSLSEWNRFVQLKGTELFGFEPIKESGTALWRAYDSGYQIGKYILPNTSKLLTFGSSYFSSLPDTPLRGIYIAEELGKDTEPVVISNNEEYRLKTNEYLFIEYTPSSTTEDGTTQELSAVTEVYGPGTIIRPSGFETGLIDSSVYESLGHTHHKTVTFTVSGAPTAVDMQRFGANEQVEIRDFAQVELNRKTFNSSPSVYIYKNFNNCDELENVSSKSRTYTLKDGEYIFYTDENKAELAYYTTGTQVTLKGNTTIPQAEIIDIATIFESGIKEIPWSYKPFSGDDAIIFQEYQYITLGPNDTINRIELVDATKNLSAEWQYCDKAIYTLAGSGDNAVELSPVNALADSKGNGWEVMSTLELDVSYDSAQVLRKTPQLETSITLTNASASGVDGVEPIVISPRDEKHPIAFKTNLTCQTGSNHINIEDVPYNPTKLNGFEVKVFAPDTPTIVKTEQNTLIPSDNNKEVVDNLAWPLAEKAFKTKEYSDLWSNVKLEDLQVSKSNYEHALRLPVSVLPNTYGVFSIYINYTSDEAQREARTWIEVLPGMTSKDITLLNVPNISEDDIAKFWEDASAESNKPNKLYLNPGINCVRVNKTSNIFIKTSDKSQGMLYFDELRLVDCQPVEYTLEGKKYEKSTQGLNLAQLGYLDTTSDETFSPEMKKLLMASYAEDTYAEVDSLEQVKNKEISNLKNKLHEVEASIQNITKFAENAKKELAQTSEYAPDYLTALIAKYQQISEALSQEKELLEALDKNKNIDSLEQQLIQLLESLSTTETTQQQLLAKLDTLKAEALARAKHFSSEAVLQDFEDFGPYVYDLYLDELIAACVEQIESHYNKQLVALADSIERVVNSDERSRLLSVLKNLQATDLTGKHTELAVKISQLADLVNRSELTALLDTIYLAAQGLEYKTLASSLAQLRESLQSDKLSLLISEIEAIANEGSDAQILDLINDLLKTLNGETGSTPLVDSTIITIIENLITSAETEKSKVTITISGASKEVDLDVAANELRNKISSAYYTTNLTTTINDIKTLLTSLTASNSAVLAIESLQESQDSQVAEIVDKLSIITAERAANLTIATLLTGDIDDYEGIPFGKEAILSFWPAHMEQDVTDVVEDTYTEIYEIISTLPSIEEIADFENPLGRIILSKAANMEAFESLYNQAVDLARKNTQNSANRVLIEGLSDELLPISTSISGATIKNDTTDRYLVISSIIEKVSNPAISITEKQQALSALRTELETAIKLDEDIYSVIASLICPSVLMADKNMPAFYSDDFYTKLEGKIEEIKNNLRNKESSEEIKSYIAEASEIIDSIIASDSKLLSILKLSTDAFRSGIKDLDLTSSVLPNDYVNAVKEIQDIIKLLSEVTVAKGAPFFKTGFFNNVVTTALEKTAATTEGQVTDETEAPVTNQAPVSTRASEQISAWIAENIEISDIEKILTALLDRIETVEGLLDVPEGYKTAYKTYILEQQLLADIREIDRNRDFYYNAPIETSLAIDFNERETVYNTLMNPAFNYDINNINNNFVISKLDIDYLDSGLQITRSSRL